MRDIKRCHYRDALGTGDLSRALYLAHLLVEILDSRVKRITLVIRARDLISAPHDVDVDGLLFGAHGTAVTRGST